MTFSEYLRYEAPPGLTDQLIHGEIRLSPSVRAADQDICKRLERLLDSIIPPTSFVAQRDTTLFVGGSEGPRPDVFVIGKDRWNAARNSALGYPEGVPELVINVRSASNSSSEMETKRAIYFSDPRCAALWIINPNEKTVDVFTPSHPPTRFALGESIPLPALIGVGSLSTGVLFS